MKIADVRKNAFAMPLTSPAFPPGPYRFIDREYLIITYRTDKAALEAVVPEPLTFDEPLVAQGPRRDATRGRCSGKAPPPRKPQDRQAHEPTQDRNRPRRGKVSSQ